MMNHVLYPSNVGVAGWRHAVFPRQEKEDAMKRLALQSNRKCRWPALASLRLLIVALAVRNAEAANIFVTTTADNISTTGGCSLQEAIYSGNFDSNLAITHYGDAFGSTHRTSSSRNACPVMATMSFILPANALFLLSGNTRPVKVTSFMSLLLSRKLADPCLVGYRISDVFPTDQRRVSCLRSTRK